MEKQKIQTLQSLRGLAFMGIFLSHLGLAKLGAWSVSVFFILSGFVMYYSYENKTLACSIIDNVLFAIKKVKRLYPLHLLMLMAALVFMAAGFFLHSERSSTVIVSDISQICLNTMLLQTFVPREEFYFSLNSVSWYLSVSLFLYFAFPFIISRVKKCKWVKAAFVIIGGMYVVLFIMSGMSCVAGFSKEFQKWLTYINPLFRVFDFIIGNYLGFIYLNKTTRRDGGGYTLVQCIALLLIIITYLIHINNDIAWFNDTLLNIPSAGLFVYVLACRKGLVSKCIDNKFLLFLGDVSPFGFLIHQMVIRYYDSFSRHVFVAAENQIIRCLICIFIAIIASVLWKQIDIKLHQRTVKR